MELWKNTLMTLASVMVLASCANEKKMNPRQPQPDSKRDSRRDSNRQWRGGATVTLRIESVARWSDFLGYPVNNPTDIRLNVDLRSRGSRYEGDLRLSFRDNRQYREGVFSSGSNPRALEYNAWSYFENNYRGFHSVHQDQKGGLVFVIDGWVDLGDGEPRLIDKEMSGSLWYRNFGFTYAPQPPTPCWLVSNGPFDCRPWTNAGDSGRKAHPNNHYYKLGTFSGLNLKKAFNGQTHF